MRLQGMDLNSFFLDAIDCETIKVAPTPTINTAFLDMALCQNLPRPSYKSMLTISHIVKPVSWSLNFHGLKFLSFRPLRYKDGSARPFI